MHQENYFVSSQKVACYFNDDFSHLKEVTSQERAVIITDEIVQKNHPGKFHGWKTIVIKAGEQYKQQATVDYIIKELINIKANRQSYIIGVGGGVVTDIAGYAASVYMRGIRFGFVPTTILAMVDASVGGKNGIDVGVYKNLVGAIKQPEFLLYDYSFLQTLPRDEWVNGFAEIIKHACIKDEELFKRLEERPMKFFQGSAEDMDTLIKRNVEIKYNVVSKDEFETGERRLLNFGHTIGHAIENIYTLPHGHAVSIGMAAACSISEVVNDLRPGDRERVVALLQNFDLPVQLTIDKNKVWDILVMDKKSSGLSMNFVLLNNIGEAVIKAIPVTDLHRLFKNLQF